MFSSFSLKKKIRWYNNVNPTDKGEEKMKLIEIIKQVDKTEENAAWVNTMELGEEFYLDVPYAEQERLRAFWVSSWLCTDTVVGSKLYFLDDEAVAYSTQSSRKSDEVFYWLDLDAVKKVKDYLISLIVEEEIPVNVKLLDIQTEIGDSFKIDFNNNILSRNRVSYLGEKVTLVERIKNKPWGIDTALKIQLPDGAIEEVDVKDLDFGYHLASDK